MCFILDAYEICLKESLEGDDLIVLSYVDMLTILSALVYGSTQVILVVLTVDAITPHTKEHRCI